jgi:general secretion pathway protein L
METLLIRLYSRPVNENPVSETDASPTAEWQVLGSNRLPSGEPGYGALEEAAAAAHYRRTVVLVPSEDILLTRVDIKVRNREQLGRALPFALEEELAEDVEQLHFAPGPRQPDGTHPVAVVSRTLITQWLTQLSAVGVTAHALIPDVLALPVSENRWSLLLEKDRALLRSGSFSGFALEPANLKTLLTCGLEDAPAKPEVIELYGSQGDTDPRLPHAESADPSVTYEQREGHPPQLWAAGLDEKRSINLLQAHYRSKSGIARLLKPWRVAAALLGVWLVLQAVETVLDYQRLAEQDRTMQAEIEQIYRETFPNATRVINPRLQMEQQLQALQQAGKGDSLAAFMPLISAGGQAIQDTSGVTIDTLDYLDGRLELSLSARELQAFEAIKQNLKRQGLTADIQSAETRGDDISGRLVVREAHG